MIEKLNLDNQGLPENESAIERKINELIDAVNELQGMDAASLLNNIIKTNAKD